MIPKILMSVYALAIGINVFVVIAGALIPDWSLVSVGAASGALCGYGLWRSINTFN